MAPWQIILAAVLSLDAVTVGLLWVGGRRRDRQHGTPRPA